MTVTKATQALVKARDGGKCVICGAPATNLHHRKPRKHGDNTPANMLSLCGSGTTGCHGHITTHPHDAYTHGWSIRTNNDPTEIPVLVRMHEPGGNRFVLLDQDGERIIITLTDAYQRLYNAGLRTDKP